MHSDLRYNVLAGYTLITLITLHFILFLITWGVINLYTCIASCIIVYNTQTSMRQTNHPESLQRELAAARFVSMVNATAKHMFS